MNFIRTSSCPKCGAPIWSDTNKENSLNPPNSHFTCDCSNNKLISNKKENEMVKNESLSNLLNTLINKLDQLTVKVNGLTEKIEAIENTAKEKLKNKFLKD